MEKVPTFPSSVLSRLVANSVILDKNSGYGDDGSGDSLRKMTGVSIAGNKKQAASIMKTTGRILGSATFSSWRKSWLSDKMELTSSSTSSQLSEDGLSSGN